ncbi:MULTISPECIES: hypothetical protein [unclassified Mesorhizobium]|uniref:hypothetical protein n=1 Tax=unclassified Mesorhizobium TaxID=325217 RepID=UPI00333D4D0B
MWGFSDSLAFGINAAGNRVVNPQPGALYSCMDYQGFKIAEPGQQEVTEVTNYVTMYGWEHGWLKRTLDTLRGWMK